VTAIHANEMKVVNEGIEGNVCSAKHDILKEEKKLEA
jgi:hypothetical protein